MKKECAGRDTGTVLRGKCLVLAWCAVLLAGLAPGAFAAPQQRDGAAEADREAALLFNTASRLYRQENWREAEAAFDRFITRFPAHDDVLEARLARGYSRHRLGKNIDAVADLRAVGASGRAPFAADASFYLGRALEALAAEGPEGATKRQRYLAEAADAYAAAAAAREAAWSAARRDPAESPRLRDAYLRACVAAGEAYYQSGDVTAAERALEPLLARRDELADSPRALRGLYFLALARFARARSADADADAGAVDDDGRRGGGGGGGREGSARYAPVLAALAPITAERYAEDPLWEEAAFLAARLHERAGETQAAAALYERVARRGGTRSLEAEFHRHLVDAAADSREAWSRAADGLARFAAEHPEHALAAQALFHEGLALFNLGRFADAAARLERFQRVTDDAALRAEASLRLGQAFLFEAPPDPERALAALAAVPPPAAGGEGAERAARARYWQAEALLAARDPERAREAATRFAEIATRSAVLVPDLVEDAFHKSAVAHFQAGHHAECAQSAARYRAAYPAGAHLAESLALSGRNALHAPAGALEDAERARAPRYFLEAAGLVQEEGQALELEYLAGVAHYHLGEYEAAAARLEGVTAKLGAERLATPAFADAVFYVADAYLRCVPPVGDLGEADAARLRRAATLFRAYAGRTPRGAHDETARLDLAYAHARLGDQRAARDVFLELLAAYPEHARRAEIEAELADLHVALGDPSAARRSYGEAFARTADPALAARVVLRHAALEREADEPERALRVLEDGDERLRNAAARAAGELDEVTFQRALTLLELERPTEAREALAAFVQEFPQSARVRDARLQLGHVLLDAGDAAGATEAIRPLLESAGDGRDEALYLHAWALAERRERATDENERRDLAAQIRAAYEEIADRYPGSRVALEATLELAQLHFNEGALTEAKARFEALIAALEEPAGEERDDDSGAVAGPRAQSAGAARRAALLRDGAFGLAFVRWEEKEFSSAATLFDRAAAAGGSEGELATRALFHAAKCFLLSEEETEAVKRFRSVAGRNDAAALELREEALLRLGECLHRLQDYPAAAATLRRLLAAYPDGALANEARFALGFALQYDDRLAEAIEAFREVTRRTSSVTAARAQYHLGECFMDQEAFREAAREFLVVVANFDFDGGYREWYRRALLAAGIAYDAAGDREAAETQWRELIEKHPESDEARAARGRLR